MTKISNLLMMGGLLLSIDFFAYGSSKEKDLSENHEELNLQSLISQSMSCQVFENQAMLDDGSKAKVESHLEGQLSPFWAQEYIGADLAKAYMSKHSPKRKVKVGILDSGFLSRFPKGRVSQAIKNYFKEDSESRAALDTHGTKVGHLIVGNAPVGTSYSSQIALQNFDVNTNSVKWTLDAIEKVKPEVINLSLSFHEPPTELKSMLEKLTQKALVVKSAANDFPVPLEPTIQEIGKFIVVGSLSPLGLPSGTSREGAQVTLLAPADQYIYSIRGGKQRGMVELFGKTSAATPLVTAALANALAYLPSLSFEEAKTLLQKSAIAVASSKNEPHLAGAGMLNAYKVVRVAERIHKSKERLAQLTKPETYDFSNEAAQLLTKAKDVLQKDTFDLKQTCDNQRLGVDLLRESYLLHPTEESRSLLAKFYQGHGLIYNAAFYEGLGSKESLQAVIRNGLRDSHPFIKASATRGLPLLEKEALAALQAVQDKLNEEIYKEGSDTYTFALLGMAKKLDPSQPGDHQLGPLGTSILKKLIAVGSEYTFRTGIKRGLLSAEEEIAISATLKN